MAYIRLGFCNINGTKRIYVRPLEQAKSCNFCKHFQPRGLHALAAYCGVNAYNGDDLHFGNYWNVAQQCKQFDCRPNCYYDDDLKPLVEEPFGMPDQVIITNKDSDIWEQIETN